MANDIFRFCTDVFWREDVDAIRTKLAEALCKERIIEKWKQVLDYPTGIVDIGADSCIAVMFHDIEFDYSGIDYEPKGFADLVKKIYERGLRLCSAHDFFQAPQSDRLIICTFDDGYEGVYKNALPIMAKYGFTATVYVCPDMIGKDNSWNHKDAVMRRHLDREMLIELRDSGWELGSHGMNHINLLRLSEQEIEKCLADSKEQLSEFGLIESFCYPYGQYNSFIKSKVMRYYQNAFSVDIGGNNFVTDLYQICRFTPEQLKRRLEL